jgi:predicted nucleotidyltransferase component of viral defense system
MECETPICHGKRRRIRIMIDQDKIYSVVDQYGFQQDTVEKIYRLTYLLQQIFSDHFLKGQLALKGGTAINSLYFQFPRLSVDIDLDFTNNVTKSEMLQAKQDIGQVLEELLSTFDYHVNQNKSSFRKNNCT